MLIILQVPIFDIRKFQKHSLKTLCHPNWRFIGDNDLNSFVRSIGPVSLRKKGIKSVAENYFSKARRGIRFDTLPEVTFADGDQIRNFKMRPKFRRFFSDGGICAKYEIGFSIDEPRKKHFTHTQLENLLTSVLACKVSIPIPYQKKVSTTIFESNRYLANQYLQASTLMKKKDATKNATGVYFGLPCFYIECTNKEVIEHNFPRIKFETIQAGHILSLFRTTYKNKAIKVWQSCSLTSAYLNSAREYRAAILNMNVFRDAFHFILKSIEDEKLLPEPRSTESNQLQFFIKDCFSKYFKKVPSNIQNSDFELLTLRIEDELQSGQRQKLEANLRNIINVRGNYFNLIKSYLDNLEASASNVPAPESMRRVLFLAANPADSNRLNSGGELRRIKEVLLRTVFEVDSELAVKIATITRAMQARCPEIVHFTGHGELEGIIVENDEGKTVLFSTEGLGKLFKLFKNQVKCVLLNACYSAEQAKVISEHGIYVIGMKSEIGDAAALAFSVGFYQSLAENNSTFDLAFDLAIIGITPYKLDVSAPELWLNGVRMKP